MLFTRVDGAAASNSSVLIGRRGHDAWHTDFAAVAHRSRGGIAPWGRTSDEFCAVVPSTYQETLGTGTTVGQLMAASRLVGVDQARVSELGQLPEPDAVVLAVGGSVARVEIPALCDHLRALVEGGRTRESVVCDLAALVKADLAAVEALARLQLTARRLGCRVHLRNPSDELAALVELAGLSEVLPLEPGAPDVKRPLPLEPRRKAEEREEPVGVEEEGDSADPTT